jgi:hypothetical protein
MAMSRMGKLKVFFGVIGLLGLVALWQVGRYYYYLGYAKGTKSGYLRKLQTKGPPYCKYVLGEVVLQRGGEVAQGGEVWEFSIDSGDEHAPVLFKELRDAEKSGKLVTFQFRQDLHMWWRCAPTEYFVTGLEK